MGIPERCRSAYRASLYYPLAWRDSQHSPGKATPNALQLLRTRALLRGHPLSPGIIATLVLDVADHRLCPPWASQGGFSVLVDSVPLGASVGP